MNEDEREMYATFIMGMRQRGKQENDSDSYIASNAAAENLYGEKYPVIRNVFNDMVKEQWKNKSETFKY